MTTPKAALHHLVFYLETVRTQAERNRNNTALNHMKGAAQKCHHRHHPTVCAAFWLRHLTPPDLPASAFMPSFCCNGQRITCLATPRNTPSTTPRHAVHDIRVSVKVEKRLTAVEKRCLACLAPWEEDRDGLCLLDAQNLLYLWLTPCCLPAIPHSPLVTPTPPQSPKQPPPRSKVTSGLDVLHKLEGLETRKEGIFVMPKEVRV